jgi:hypothetical protein
MDSWRAGTIAANRREKLEEIGFNWTCDKSAVEVAPAPGLEKKWARPSMVESKAGEKETNKERSFTMSLTWLFSMRNLFCK